VRNPVMTPKDGVAWITGASSGIGKAVALKLAREGWTVAITARRQEELEALAGDVETDPKIKGKLVPFAGDTTDGERMKQIVAQIEEAEGPVALAILNAGIYIPVDAPKFQASDFQKSVDVNLMGTANGLEPLIATMTKRGKGHIALVSSVTGYGGLPTSSAYGATKAALNNMAECLKIELDRVGVRVSLICPGFVETPAQDDNTFPKPFIVTPETAANRIVRGLKGNSFEITFPKRFTFVLKMLRWLPRDAYIWAIKRQTGWAKPISEGGYDPQL